MAAMPEGTHEFLRFAQYFSEKAIADGASVDGIVGLMGQLWQRRDSIPEIKAYQEAATFDELDAAAGAILTRLTGKGGGSAPASQGTSPEGLEQVATTGSSAPDDRATMPVRDGGVNPNINLNGPPQGEMLAEDMSGKMFPASQDNPAWYAQQQQQDNAGLASVTGPTLINDTQTQAPVPNLGQSPASGYEPSTRQMVQDHLAKNYFEPAAKRESGLASASVDEGPTDEIKRENMSSAGFSLDNVQKRRKAAQKRSEELDKSIKKLEAGLENAKGRVSDLKQTPASGYQKSAKQITREREGIEKEIDRIEKEISAKQKKRREIMEEQIKRIDKQIADMNASRLTGLSDVGAR